jgi:hypothetical protein
MFCFFNILFAVICGIVAQQKGRNVLGWSLLGLLGLIPLIIVACLPNLNEQKARDDYAGEENRRLREQLRQERIKSESFRQHATARLDAHDQHLGLDTRSAGPTLGTGQTPGQLSSGDPLTLDINQADIQWYYGKQGKTVGPVKPTEVAELINLQVITPQTLLWSEQMPDWQPAVNVPQFAPLFV